MGCAHASVAYAGNWCGVKHYEILTLAYTLQQLALTEALSRALFVVAESHIGSVGHSRALY